MTSYECPATLRFVSFLESVAAPELSEADLKAAAAVWAEYIADEKLVELRDHIPHLLQARPLGTACGVLYTWDSWMAVAHRLSRHLPGILVDHLEVNIDAAIGIFNAVLRARQHRLAGGTIVIRNATIVQFLPRRLPSTVPHDLLLPRLQDYDEEDWLPPYFWLRGRTLQVLFVSRYSRTINQSGYRPAVLLASDQATGVTLRSVGVTFQEGPQGWWMFPSGARLRIVEAMRFTPRRHISGLSPIPTRMVAADALEQQCDVKTTLRVERARRFRTILRQAVRRGAPRSCVELFLADHFENQQPFSRYDLAFHLATSAHQRRQSLLGERLAKAAGVILFQPFQLD